MDQRSISIFTCLYTGYVVITYIRKSVSFASPALIGVENINTSQFGLILSCQMVGYTVGKLMGGVLVDMYSPSFVFITTLVLAAGSVVSFTVFDTVVMFAICWFINGLAQGPSWPACGLLIKRLFPADKLGTWWSIMSTSMNVSGTAGPLLSTYLLTVCSWRSALNVAGTSAIAVAAMCMLVLSDGPKERTDVSSQQHRNVGTTGPSGSVSWRRGVQDLLMQRAFLAVCLNYLLVSIVRGASTDWGHLYLIYEKHHSPLTGSSFTSSQELGGIAGTLVAGYVSDFLMAKKMGVYNPRLLVIFCCTVIQSVSIFIFITVVSSASSSLLICLLGFCLGFGVYGCITLFGVVAMESAVDTLSGTAHSIVAFAASVGLVLSGFPLSVVAKLYTWHFAFFLVQLVAIVTTIIAVYSVHLSSRTPVKLHTN